MSLQASSRSLGLRVRLKLDLERERADSLPYFRRPPDFPVLRRWARRAESNGFQNTILNPPVAGGLRVHSLLGHAPGVVIWLNIGRPRIHGNHTYRFHPMNSR